MSKRVVIISDMNCGHRVGLTHPTHQPDVSPDASRGKKKLGEERVQMWKWFAKTIGALRPINTLIVNGDCVEGKGARSGGTELLSADVGDQAGMAADVINYVGAERVCMTYGTPYHVGQIETDWEDVVFSRVENAVKIEAEGHYDVNGLQIVCKHYIGNTSSPASRGTALSNAQVKQMFWAARKQQPTANLIVRSHVHRAFCIQDPAANFMALTTPALQGCGSKYGSRQCDGLPVDFGIVSVDVVSETSWGVRFHIAPAEYAKCSVEKL